MFTRLNTHYNGIIQNSATSSHGQWTEASELPTPILTRTQGQKRHRQQAAKLLWSWK